jgi:hypothetical protein
MELPWEVLASRFGKFLDAAYVATMLSGAFIIAELIIPLLPGPAEHRQQVLATLASRILTAKLNVFVVILLAVIAVVLSYLVGYIAIALFWGVLWSFVQNIYNFIRVLFSRPRSPDEKSRVSPTGRRRISVGWGARREYDLGRPLDLLRYLFSSLTYPQMTQFQPAEVWGELKEKYGEDRVKTALTKHPINIEYGNEWQMYNVYDYFRLWLQRYTTDTPWASTENKSSLLGSMIVPLLLAPRAIESLLGHNIHYGLTLNLATAILASLLLVLAVTRIGKDLPVIVFRHFVVVQLVEGTKPPESVNKSKDTQSNVPDHPIREQHT